MSISEAISKAADAAKAVVAGITPDQLELATPCTEWDVRALGNHLTGFLPYSANAARKDQLSRVKRRTLRLTAGPIGSTV